MRWPELDERGFAKTVADLPEDARALIAACDLVRANGYEVIDRRQRDWWVGMVESCQREMTRDRDAYQMLIHEVQRLHDEVGRLLGGSRPRWFRRSKAFMANAEYQQEISGGPDSAGVVSARG